MRKAKKILQLYNIFYIFNVNDCLSKKYMKCFNKDKR